MFSHTFAASMIGLQPKYIKVEVDLNRRGFPVFKIVGLPHTSIREARERVKSAIQNSGFSFPQAKIIVNLSPSDVPKRGSVFDTAIAVAILSVDDKRIARAAKNSLFMGELALNGDIKPVSGVAAVVLDGENNFEEIYIPHANNQDAQYSKDKHTVPVKTLKDLIEVLTGHKKAQKVTTRRISVQNISADDDVPDMNIIKGQDAAKRALEVAAVGKHSVLMTGPPGVGKTMLAQAFQGILPNISEKHAKDVLKVQSLESADKRSICAPFRTPHSSSTVVAMIGGGSPPMPGEITRAHAGVLFLDELPEFKRQVIENLRQPIESKTITLSKGRYTVTYPADFQLIATSNLCPCGYLGHHSKPCDCTSAMIRGYRKKLSGPILDRIEMHISVSDIKDSAEIHNNLPVDSTKDIQKRVKEARRSVERHYNITSDAQNLINSAREHIHLSMRSYKTVKLVARSIAALNKTDTIDADAMSEAIQYRKRAFG